MSTAPSVAAGFSFAASTHARHAASVEPLDRVDVDLGDRVRVLGRDVLDLDAALRREHAEVLLGRPVEGERRVVLLGDVARVLDPDHLDGVALDVHADDVGRVPARLVGVRRELDAAGLAAAADLHLRLHHDRVADAVGGGDRVVDRRDRLAGRHGDAVPREELLALVFEQVHGTPRVDDSRGVGAAVGCERWVNRRAGPPERRAPPRATRGWSSASHRG